MQRTLLAMLPIVVNRVWSSTKLVMGRCDGNRNPQEALKMYRLAKFPEAAKNSHNGAGDHNPQKYF